MRASVAITPGPPALVTMANREPKGGRTRATNSAVSKISPISHTRTASARRKAASQTASSPARAPVWELAARADSVKRPALYTTMGLVRAKARAADMNRRACEMDST